MSHPLDNPAWHALHSGNRSLAHGNGSIAYFWPDVSPFAAMQENTVDNLHVLYESVPFDSRLAVLSPAEIMFPPQWNVVVRMNILQMVCTRPVQLSAISTGAIPLEDAHVPDMLALTKLTKPGPFAQHTIRFGHYEGIYDGGQLAAMAGQRLHPKPYAEISAVCTHPDHTGRGLATQLLMRQVHRIQSAGEIPFLHVKSDNTRAIRIYSELGFEKRATILIYFIKKNTVSRSRFV
ncbi:GNAT family N-acetyltransferase [Parapedobacter sp. DT-150]|uniref:GNAT family N-acetyltransferase n=1 Tax=Parapedobacter sp. DT-150 TaxID=3396162 RepID=UPI003F540693